MTVRNLIGCGRYEDAILRPIAERAEELLCLAFQKRAKVALGSDAGAFMVPHGRGICQEFDFFFSIFEPFCHPGRISQDLAKRIKFLADSSSMRKALQS